MKTLVGKKVGMTQVFNEKGQAVPVTVIQAGPCVVTQVKTADKDGYSAVQIGYGEDKKPSKPATGHLKKSKATPRYLKEFRIEETENEEALKVGDTLDVSVFEEGDKVVISGVSKGKGFAGTIKRHNFSRGPMSHGSRNKRRPGSIGSMYPQKVFKGKKMAGRMGGEKVSVKNLKVVKVDKENNILAVSGAVPGSNKSIVIIKG
ncbi:MAG: 50S ribosomal protein L3 [Candidatus Saccharimonadales bacterium]